MPRVVLLVAVLVPLFGAAACGDSDSKDENAYVAAVNKVNNEFADEIESVAADITPRSSVKQDRRALRRFTAAVDRAVRQHRAIQPPPKVRTLHQDLIEAISRYRTEVEKVRRAFAQRDRRSLIRAERRFQAAIRMIGARINRTTEAINAELRE